MPKPKERRTCAQPDRHEPRIRCGYPLPCPYHTLVVEAGRRRSRITGRKPRFHARPRTLADVIESLEALGSAVTTGAELLGRDPRKVRLR